MLIVHHADNFKTYLCRCAVMECAALPGSLRSLRICGGLKGLTISHNLLHRVHKHFLSKSELCAT